jgi:hypothetical protein
MKGKKQEEHKPSMASLKPAHKRYTWLLKVDGRMLFGSKTVWNGIIKSILHSFNLKETKNLDLLNEYDRQYH